jgi:SAM-dependent methyltransferase
MSTHPFTSGVGPDPAKVQELLDRFVGDLGAALAWANALIGDRLGLYRALADGGPQTPRELAEHTGTEERHIHEWLCGQAAGGYVTYDAQAATFSLTPEQAACLADEDSPSFVPGAFQVVASLYRDEDKLLEAFRTGRGVTRHERHEHLLHGTARFARPRYAASLTTSWIPALDGVHEKLEAGALIADVGCGRGASTLVLADAYPACEIVGFDPHDASIAVARAVDERAGVVDRVRFEIAPASTYSGGGYDLVATLDCLHDMGDPLGAARHVRRTLAEDGTWLLVEPCAGDRVEALGAGEKRLREIAAKAGFSRFRRVAVTRFDLVLEARP